LIVIDASVLANVVGDDGPGGRAARDRIGASTRWSAPDLVDVETVSVLRRRWRAGDLTARRFRSAVVDLLSLPIVRFPTGPLMHRAYELRSNLTPYDATYIALAEGLSCALVSADGRLARAPGIHCHVDVLVF
jgi:predicted nucleic acid-binding protein